MPEETKKSETETTPEPEPEKELDEKDLEQVGGGAYEFYNTAVKLDKNHIIVLNPGSLVVDKDLR